MNRAALSEQELIRLGVSGVESVAYFRFHEFRYEFLIRTIAPFLSRQTRVLDISVSALPRLLLGRFPGLQMVTLGFADRRYWTPGEWPHIECNLNDAEFDWDSIGAFDLVIMAEVIEHLYTPPNVVLQRLSRVLEPHGRLVIQTPNAASLEKRVKLALGRNPYEMIRSDLKNPGHFREYTIGELRALATACGFAIEELSATNYFNPATISGRIYNRLCALAPASFRDGITTVLIKN